MAVKTRGAVFIRPVFASPVFKSQSIDRAETLAQTL